MNSEVGSPVSEGRALVYASRLTLISAMMGVVLVSVDVSVVNVAIDALKRSLDVQMTGLQWILNVYTLAYAVFLLSAGALNDRIGARATFLLGLAAFTLSSLACGLAPSFFALLVARTVQGMGAALLVPSAMALLQQTFPDEKQRARAIGLWAGAGSLALAGGPVLGGALIAHVGWRSIFLINLPIGLMGTWLAFSYAPPSPKPEKREIDVVGQLVAALSLACVTGALTQAGDLGWTNPWIGCGLIAGSLLFVVFLRIEAGAKHPMMPLTLFRDATFSTAIFVGAVINFVFYGLVFVFSLFFQAVQGKSAFATGLAFVPMTAIIMLVNVVAGQLIGRRGLRPIMLAGLLVAGAGYSAMLSIGDASSYVAIAPTFLAAGVGIALAVPALMAAAMSGSEPGRAGIGAGVLNSGRQVGGAMGVAVFGSIIGAQGPSRFVAGMHISIGLAAATLFAASVAAFFFIRPTRSELQPST